MMITTNDYDSFINCTENQNDDIPITIKIVLLSIPSSILLLNLITLLLWTILKPF